MSAFVLDYRDFMHPSTPQDRLTVTLFLALLAHLLFVFGVGFEFEKPAQRINTSLEIILVQTESESKPTPTEKADYLAQANQEGGGTVEDTVHPTTMTPAPFPDAENRVISASAPPQVAMAEPEPVVEQLVAPEISEPEVLPEAEELPPETPPDQGRSERTQVPVQQPDALDLIISAHRAVASIQATLDRKNREFAKRPRRKYIGAHTQEYRFAGYMESWRRKIERVGTLNFPDEARRRGLSGELTMDVAINADGTVAEIEILSPSEHTILDEAAIQIVRLAQPFAPFPESIRKDTDILHITRRWQFSSDGSLAGTRW